MLRSQAVGVFNLLCAFNLTIITSTCLVGIAKAQNRPTNATTDPTEVAAINSIFKRWGLLGGSIVDNGWTIDPCTGAALNASINIYTAQSNPTVKCNCSFSNGAICHIIELKVERMNGSHTIPDELWSLKHLTGLTLDRSYLTGSLSPAIANLSRLETLIIAHNSLSGELPKELGLLTGLRFLAFATNNFSGPLPSELGNLTNLEQLYFDSSGVSGEIPSTFANLRNLVAVWAFDNELTGKIPAFIGNWTKLKILRFEGNSFEGPIPSELANLTSLRELRISDLSNGSSGLDFLKDMKSLTDLVLRNNNISGTLPSNIGEYQNLRHLDLSFNSINGPIPDSLFSLSSLSYLFLGNNKLNGTLPSQKSPYLLNIDVSYNNLVGSLPSWVDEESLQLNLVANNFTTDHLVSYLPLGLNCLQRNFPCNRGSPRYSQFAIKCGGPQFTSSAGIVYESDNATLGPATYYVTDTSRWGVSNVGYFTGTNSPRYILSSSSSQFTNTLDPQLFQTARISASSLRYFGLGLRNGNYTVTLQFAETAIPDANTHTWESLGRRIFDVYVQGNRVLKDFDIRRAAGGVSNKVVQRDFIATVTENYLEIHLFWVGKGTWGIPAPGTYGPLISAISATSDLVPAVRKNFRTRVIAGIVIGIGVASFLLAFAALFIVRRRKRQSTFGVDELLGIDAKPYTFSYTELKTATEDFHPANKLGEGGFGAVYQGKLNDGRVIAVKQLSVASHQGKSQFVAEIATISAVQHRNLVKLYGCCIEGDSRLLVYEYLENKSLDQALFGKSNVNLDWSTRYGICLGVGRGLAYLHEESRLRIVHRDVKASNILLDSDIIPKISDFGLAKLYDDKKTHISTRVAGTIGYLAPEYAMRGHLTEKADVYGFGIVALEIVSGRPNSNMSFGEEEEEEMYLLERAWHLYQNKREIELVDPKLADFNEEEVKRMIRVALLCTQTSPSLRPPMSRVVAMLSGDIEVSNVTSRPGYLTDWKFEDFGSSSVSGNATIGTDTPLDNSTTAESVVSGPKQSPVLSTKPMLHDFIEGRN